MIQFAELFNDCLSRFRETPEYITLNNNRPDGDGLSAQERQAIIDSVEHTFARLFDKIKADASSLTDSDLVFCVLSYLGIGATTIADCLTISPRTVRVRKHRLREKLPASWYDVFYGEGELVEEPVRQGLPILREIGACFRNYFRIEGRASRMEYFCFLFFTVIVVLTNNSFDNFLYHFTYTVSGTATVGFFTVLLHVISWIVMIGILIPMYTVTVRRLHDLNCSGSLALLFCGLPSAIVIAQRTLQLFFLDEIFGGMSMPYDTALYVMVPLHYSNTVLYIMFFVQLLVFSIKRKPMAQ